MSNQFLDAWVTSPVMIIAIVPGAAIVGRLLTWGVSRLIEPGRGDARRCRTVEILTVVAAVALWWWEVIAQGQLPAGVPAAARDIAPRYAGHMILFFFLAAAAWVDLRHRVIPDAITVPGALAGLAWNALFPFTLPPIATLIERSFATPEVQADALGMAGGIAGTVLPSWLSGPTGLAVAVVLFFVWWWFGTSPEDVSPSATPKNRSCWTLDGPLAAGLIGGGILITSWIVGGDHWAGLIASLVGLTVAGGLVWATRTGASWALGREAMGFGDVTLMAMAGAWLGWQACLLACVIAVFIGLVHGVTQLVVRSETELPFGPSLCMGLGIVVVAWRPVWELAGSQLNRPLEMAIVVSLVIVLTAITLWAWARLRGGSSEAS